MPTTFTILGSGAGNVSAHRGSASYVLTYKNRQIIFDCGSGAVSSFLRSGFDPLDIEAIFISHMHTDHVCELPLFIQKLYLTGREDRLPVFVPSEAVKPLNFIIAAGYLFKKKLSFELDLIPMEPMVSLFDGKIIINPVPNRHLMGNVDIIESEGYPNRMQSFSFMINVENCALFYSADIESLNDIEKNLHGLDMLIVETTHIDFIQLRELIKGRQLKRVILTHIAEDMEEDIRSLADSEPDIFEMAEDNLTLDI
jgi:ribonuclease Z